MGAPGRWIGKRGEGWRKTVKQERNRAGARLFEHGALAPYVVKRQRALLGEALPKTRGARLLEVNCGEGTFLSLYEERHFAVSISEISPVARARLHEKMPGMEIYAACADHLPFPDGGFDWVIYHPGNEEIEKSLAECLRVSRHGLIIAFWNSFSLAAIFWKMGGRARAWPDTFSAPAILRIARALSPDRLVCRSTLGAPVFCWRENSIFSIFNNWPRRLPTGAWCLVSAEFGRSGVATPLGLRTAPNIGEPLGAMEYSQKNIQTCQKDDAA